ncbi:MAG: Crp/Fnr family transcriptional regulator [Pseudomonadota bacterium]
METELLDHLSTIERRTSAFDQGDVLFRQGSAVSGLYYLVSGGVALQRLTASGDKLVVHNTKPGAWFAEASLFSDVYHCDAVCTAATEVTWFAKQSVLDAIGSSPDVALAFTKRLAISVQQSRQQIELIAIASAEARVLAAIQLGLHHSSISNLAARIHLTEATCYRALRRLSNAGELIKTGRGQYRLPNAADA